MVSNFDFENALSKSDQFLGVFSADHLDKYVFRGAFKSMKYVIINTEPIGSKRVGHWISLSRYLDKNGKVILECFDSFGWPIKLFHQNIKDAIRNARFDVFVTNNKILQHPKSNYCGVYIIARFLGLFTKSNFTDFLSHFTSDLAGNDTQVERYISMITK